ncbi:hypothetical protein [Absidia glauca]|uniref:Uncharacterized protein n=1 Tax=Absidia glauca TaxID=4829 RepID=A0A163J7L1_ABSGL|nr:hypothetical protein [Absidia glauca]
MCILSSYVVFLTGIPILAYSDCFRNHLIPSWGYYLGAAKVGLDQHLLATAVATIFIYFTLNAGNDFVYTLQALYASWFGRNVSTCISTTMTATATTTITTTVTQSILPAPSLFALGIAQPRRFRRNLSQRLSCAYQKAALYYPGVSAFITSTLMIWCNTKVFDSSNTAFVIIQALFLAFLPLTFAMPVPIVGDLNCVGYRCALLWTVVYALYSRQVSEMIHFWTHHCDPSHPALLEQVGCILFQATLPRLT